MIADSYEDISSLEAVRDYFKKLYAFKGQGLDDKKILPAMSGENGSFPFGEIAKAFRMIESETMQVLVPLEGEAEMLAARLRQGERTRELMRAIGRGSNRPRRRRAWFQTSRPFPAECRGTRAGNRRRPPSLRGAYRTWCG